MSAEKGERQPSRFFDPVSVSQRWRWLGGEIAFGGGPIGHALGQKLAACRPPNPASSQSSSRNPPTSGHPRLATHVWPPTSGHPRLAAHLQSLQNRSQPRPNAPRFILPNLSGNSISHSNASHSNVSHWCVGCYETSRFSRLECLRHARVFDSAASSSCSPLTHESVLPSPCLNRIGTRLGTARINKHWGVQWLACTDLRFGRSGRMCHHKRPSEEGRSRWLIVLRRTLSFSTPSRFIPALSDRGVESRFRHGHHFYRRDQTYHRRTRHSHQNAASRSRSQRQ